MKDIFFYRLFAKTDLTDTVEPIFKLSAFRRRKITRAVMHRIKCEAVAEPSAVRVRPRRMMIAALATLLALAIPVSAVGITYVLWRPDVGLTDLDGNPVETVADVYTSAERAEFGDLCMTYVIWTNSADTSTLSVWLIGEHDGGLNDLTADGAGESRTLVYNGSDGADGHNYICTDFPFAERVTLRSAALGAEAAFVLVKREDPSIFVPEYYGISFELIPDGGEMRVIIIDRGILGAEMGQYAQMRLIQGLDWKFYDAEGNLYETQSGGGGVDDYGRSFAAFTLTRVGEETYSVVSDDGSLVIADDGSVVSGGEEIEYTAQPVHAEDIVRVEIDRMTFRYKFTDEMPGLTLAIPADGETITGDFAVFAMDGFSDRIDSIKREGNTLLVHQSQIALDYTGDIPVGDSEGWHDAVLYDEEGGQLGNTERFDYTYADDGRTAVLTFEEGLLDHADAVKIALSDLWIYIDQTWTVDLD